MKQLTILCLLAILLTGSAPGQATQLDALRQKLDTIGNLRIDVTNFQMSKEGNVIIKPPSGMLHFESDGMEVFAGRAEYIAASEQLRFTGDVAIYREGVIYRGEKATYNLNSRQLDASGMRSSIEPLFFKAANISSTGTGSGSGISVINLDSPEFTTEDSEDPGYRITADRVSIYPGDRVVFHKFKILAGDSPLFYLPYLSQPLDGEFGYSIIPGYRSNLGAFLLNQYSTTISDHSLIKYRLDLYSQRGAGAGFDLESRRYPRSSQFGKFKFYWLYDNDPETSSIGSLDSISRDLVDNNRYRVTSTTASISRDRNRATSTWTWTSTKSATAFSTKTSSSPNSVTTLSRITSSTSSNATTAERSVSSADSASMISTRATPACRNSPSTG